jgi:hypothetical protein
MRDCSPMADQCNENFLYLFCQLESSVLNRVCDVGVVGLRGARRARCPLHATCAPARLCARTGVRHARRAGMRTCRHAGMGAPMQARMQVRVWVCERASACVRLCERLHAYASERMHVHVRPCKRARARTCAYASEPTPHPPQCTLIIFVPHTHIFVSCRCHQQVAVACRDSHS